ncbi:MAG: hypothetical protein ACI8ZX_000874 [Planctomycetota bacterium]|jgi:hypothetical protein
MNKRILTFSTIFVFIIQSYSQNTYFKTKIFQINKLENTNQDYITTNFDGSIVNLEAPSPNGNSYKSFLLRQKELSKKQFPYKNIIPNKSTTAINTVKKPIVTKSFGMLQVNGINQYSPIYGGLPNDNTAAVSNDGILLLSINAHVYLHDLKKDSILYPNESVTLRNAFGLNNANYFDPKVIYDKDMDRFVMVFLKNNVPATSEIMVGFSKTNNPLDGWHVYELPGNPLNNNRWTDFPSIALSDSSFYFSGNLIIPNVTWQVGFDGSILWEMDKVAGFNGETSIEPKLYHDIKHGDNYIRNLHSVQGADGNVENLHLLSNRNFNIQNDTIFLVSLIKESDSSYLDVNAIVSNTSYGVPPNGRQVDTDTSDATEGLQTNDGRVLGAIQFEDQIQFVSNTLNPETGFSAIYHGLVNNLYSTPSITANIISDEVKDFGYPNIAWTGNEACDRETMIGFNHTSFTDSAGISAIYFNNEGDYSDVVVLKKGEGIVDRLAGGYERWGDYFGMQRKYNEPGKVYTFGMIADFTKKNYGWVNEIVSPDTNFIGFTAKVLFDIDSCRKQVKISPYGGIAPYAVEWNNDSINQDLTSSYYAFNDSAKYIVRDSRSCNISGENFISEEACLIDKQKPFTLFPNPTSDILYFQFTLIEASSVQINITDYKGAFMKQLEFNLVKKGLNELSFSTEPLGSGIYFVEIKTGDTLLSKDKFVRR